MPWASLIAVTIAAVGVHSLRLRAPASQVAAASVLGTPSASPSTRSVEGRIAGAEWAPFVRDVRAAKSGSPRDGIVASLEKASATNQPAVWSDLAAAYCEAAVHYGEPALLAEALAAADRALAIEPDRAEALFNRALVLERLGFRVEARAAWSRYVAIDTAGGWADEARERLDAPGLGSRSNELEERTVWPIVETAIARRNWHIASSFLTVYVEIRRRMGNDVELANALLLRAVVRDRLDDSRGVDEDLAEARHAASRAGDAAQQELLRVTEWRTVAMLRSTAPATANELLTRVIDYLSANGQPGALPDLLLLRARARRRANDVAGARDDVARGILQTEQAGEPLPAVAARWEAFHSAEELVEEAVDLAMIAGDHAAAFRFAEKARAQTLPPVDVRAIPARTVVVEYASLPSSAVIFAVDAKGVHAARVNVPRDALAANVAAFTRAVQKDDAADAIRRGSSLYWQLLEPVAPRVAGAATVVFVPDAVTANVPFGALRDVHGTPVQQQHAVVVAPSASAFVNANRRRR